MQYYNITAVRIFSNYCILIILPPSEKKNSNGNKTELNKIYTCPVHGIISTLYILINIMYNTRSLLWPKRSPAVLRTYIIIYYIIIV